MSPCRKAGIFFVSQPCSASLGGLRDRSGCRTAGTGPAACKKIGRAGRPVAQGGSGQASPLPRRGSGGNSCNGICSSSWIGALESPSCGGKRGETMRKEKPRGRRPRSARYLRAAAGPGLVSDIDPDQPAACPAWAILLRCLRRYWRKQMKATIAAPTREDGTPGMKNSSAPRSAAIFSGFVHRSTR